MGIVYNTASPSNANQSFCSGSSNNFPYQLVAKGPITTLEQPTGEEGPTWARLPMPQTVLKAGTYWVGVLFEEDTTCYSDGAATNPAVGPGSRDAFAYRPFASGPGVGPEMSWTRGGGSLAIYATTHP